MEDPTILQELNDLGSSLGSPKPGNPLLVPAGYFDEFSASVTDRISAEKFLSTLPRSLPFEVPTGYFENLAEGFISSLHAGSYESSREEIEAISPLLSSLRNKNVLTVPQGYFESLQMPESVPALAEKEPAKIISFSKRTWFRYAAAAVLTGIIAATAFFTFNSHKISSEGKALASFEKEVKKIDDVKQTESLIDYMNSGLNEKDIARVDINSKSIADVKKLLQDVSVDELNDFSEQSRDIENVMMQ
jgi:hypothetical protein